MGIFSFIWNSGKGVVNFVRRHRKKFMLAGVLALAYHLFRRYQSRTQTSGIDREIEMARKQQHFQSNQKTLKDTFSTLLFTIREKLDCRFDIQELTNLLKKGDSSDKLAIWEKLKVLSFAKTLCFTYSCALLYSLSSTVLNILGGYLYVQKFSNTSDCQISPVLHRRYLQLMEHFLGPGLDKLADITNSAADKVVSSINMKDKLTLADIEHILDDLRHYVEHRKNGQTDHHMFFLKFILLYDETFQPVIDLVTQDRVSEQKLMIETYDIVESEDFSLACAATLNRAFIYLLDNLVEFIPNSEVVGLRSGEGSQIHSLTNEIAMAKLIPVMSGMSNRMVNSPLFDYFQMEHLASTFSANIYECFSSNLSVQMS